MTIESSSLYCERVAMDNMSLRPKSLEFQLKADQS